MIEDDLALLGVRPALAAAQPTHGDVVDLFVDGNELLPGRALSIEMSALYRMYLDWHRATLPDREVVKPLLFARGIHRLGFKAGRKVRLNRWARALMANAATARRLRRWLELNPQPYGWAMEFQSHFWRKK